MRIAGAPDQMRSQRTGDQLAWPIRLQDQLFCQCLGMRIMAKPGCGVRCRFIYMSLVGPIEGHAGTAAEDQSRDAVPQASVHDMPRAQGIDLVVALPRSPNSGDGRRVKHDVPVSAGPRDILGLADIPLDGLDADFTQFGIITAGQAADRVASCD